MKAKVRHMVAFTLIHPKDSPEAKKFIEDSARILGSIPYAAEFIQCYEVSPKNNYDYGFSFDFMTEEDYDRYNNDPVHLDYVEQYWKKQVSAFFEMDLCEL
ncbi:Dabb family protein [Christensenellaceae bacterium OttesenSCG-928-K19]|nr:Dabb family protein [Christensenellaceae bacterium OttesenSCG-928-K19]